MMLEKNTKEKRTGRITNDEVFKGREKKIVFKNLKKIDSTN